MAMEEGSSSMRIVGGQCDYRQYKGKAEIVSVQRRELPDNNQGFAYNQYEVKFTFQPDKTIVERHGKVGRKEFLLLLSNSMYPGLKFLKKYGVVERATFDCYIKVIIRGTCSPFF
jgi:hypothetical protein